MKENGCGCNNNEPAIIYADTIKGNNGWTPVFVDEFYTVGNTVKIVRKLTDYIGGNGLKPTNFIGQYLSQNGYTPNRDLAINYKGVQGPPGPPSPSPSYTFSNGLREDNGNVKLGLNLSDIEAGGLLTEPTNLWLGSGSGIFGLEISDPAVRLSSVGSDSSASIHTAYDSSIGSSVITLQKTTTNGDQYLTFVNDVDDKIVLFDSINSKGLEYALDYSANFTDHSLVTKKWVDSQIASTPVPTLEEVTVAGSTANRAITTFGMIAQGPNGMRAENFKIWNTSAETEALITSGAGTTGDFALLIDIANNRGWKFQSLPAVAAGIDVLTINGDNTTRVLNVIGRTKGADAIATNEYVTLGQVSGLIPSPLTFENGLREEDGVVKLGLDMTTIGTTNKGILTEDTYLVIGDFPAGEASAVIISDTSGILIHQVTSGKSYTVRAAEVGGVSLEYSNSGNNQIIGMGANGIAETMGVTDSINFKGLEETDDYSANKTQYSYVTKKMLDEAPNKTSKTISSATYTFISGDENRWLIFTSATGCTVTIPNSVFSDGQGLQGVQRGAGQIEFTAGSGVTLNKSSLSNAKTAVENSVFGLRFESASTCTLFGELELI